MPKLKVTFEGTVLVNKNGFIMSVLPESEGNGYADDLREDNLLPQSVETIGEVKIVFDEDNEDNIPGAYRYIATIEIVFNVQSEKDVKKFELMGDFFSDIVTFCLQNNGIDFEAEGGWNAKLLQHL